ncbi:hypothetical protein Tco_1207228 [Tanacetum coccineum]
MDRETIQDLERDVSYRITDTWDEMEAPTTDDTDLGRRMTEFATKVAITELLAANNRRKAQFIEALKLLKRLQTQMTEFESQQGPAKGPAQPDAPEEAGSSS